MPISSFVRAPQRVLELVLPGHCAACGRPADVLCPSCRATLGRARHGTPRRAVPEPAPAGLPAVHAAAPLTDLVRALVTVRKDQGRADLDPVLGALLAAAVRGAVHASPRPGSGPLLLVPVPSSPRSRRRRGERVMEAIALAAARNLPGEVRVVRALRVTASARDQAGLGAAERSRNVHGLMEPDPRWSPTCGGGRIVLVDDVMTTGATLCEAARALRTVGVEPAAAVVGATVRRTVVRATQAD